MRITSGKARAITLKSPRGDATRPATDAARQAVFSSLGAIADGARVLDLFAGTGSYGLEALSRGAKSVVFVENAKAALDCLKANVENVKKALGAGCTTVLRADCLNLKKSALGDDFDLIFADAPYPLLLKKSAEIFEKLAEFSAENTIVMLEAPAEFEPPAGSKLEVFKRLGKCSKGKPSQLLMRLKTQKSESESEVENETL